MRRLLIHFMLLIIVSATYSRDSYRAVSRYDYYTDEPNASVAVWIPESKAGIDVSVDVVFEFNHVFRGEKVDAGQFNFFEIPLERFHEGSNELTVSFSENGKWVASDKVEVRRLSPHLSAVKVDRVTGSLIVEGMPFFPFGFYNYSPVQPALAEEEVVKGFNMMSPYQKIEGKTLKERKAYMDRCAALGMKVNYNLLSLAGGGGVGNKHYDKLSHRKRMKMLKKEIETFKDHPALLSWYISDEPLGQGVPPDSLVESYQLIKQIDPYHPVTVVFMTPWKAREYSHVMDIVMADPYPIPAGKVEDVAATAALLNVEFFMEKPVWIVPQAFGGNEWWEREPTKQELRVMTYLGIINNATGIQYFIRHGLNSFPKSTITWNEASAVALEIAEISPYLFTTEKTPKISCADPDIQVKGYYKKGAFVVVAVNTSNKPINYSYTIEGFNHNGSAHLLFENRYVQIEGGKVIDMIDGYGTRVYKIRHLSHSVRGFKVHPKNEMKDPSFENISSTGVPASCYARIQEDKGATYFLDSRTSALGDHSLRLTTPTEGEGMQLSFFPINVNEEKSYTVSVVAKALPLMYRDPGKRTFWQKICGCGPDGNDYPEFKLSFGDCSAYFIPDEEWKEYSWSCLPLELGTEKSSVGLTLEGKGTAWFDILQLYPDMRIGTDVNGEKNEILVAVFSNHRKTDIFYTVDGSEPGPDSKKYKGPIRLKESATVKTVAYKDGQRIGYIAKPFIVSKATGRYVEYKNKWSDKYHADYKSALVDGKTGSLDFKDGNWQGFEGEDLDVTITLKELTDLSQVSIRFLGKQEFWIFSPKEVKLFWSEDGVKYHALENSMYLGYYGIPIDVYGFNMEGIRAKYIRIHAENIGTCPPGHPGEGGKAWLFTDEIIIE